MPRLRLTLDYDPEWPPETCDYPACHHEGCPHLYEKCPERIDYGPLLESEDALMRLDLRRILDDNDGAGAGTGYNFKLEIIER